MKRHVLATLLPVLLCGCQTLPPATASTSTAPGDLLLSAREAQAGITRLHQSNVINQTTSSFPAALRANSDRITLQWDGDAVELLHTLARQRGYRFVYTGTRLPLPVNIYVSDMTFAQVLDLIRVQTGWRASLALEGVELRLYFGTSVKGAHA